MSKIFKPKVVMPPVPPAPKPIRYEPPTKEDSAGADPNEGVNPDAEKAAVKKKVEAKKKKSSTILTSPAGLTTEATTFETTLLG